MIGAAEGLNDIVMAPVGDEVENNVRGGPLAYP
jgi:hypothetical protein